MAINPVDGAMVIIEMNPRVSRSSALASKATGFPIAKMAAKLACGNTLDMIPNDITLKTPASFEPSIDYVVTKIPRFAFEKFPGAQVGGGGRAWGPGVRTWLCCGQCSAAECCAVLGRACGQHDGPWLHHSSLPAPHVPLPPPAPLPAHCSRC